MIGLFAVVVIAIVLLCGGRAARFVAGMLGAIVGFFVPGFPLAWLFAELAMRAHTCPDAGWLGPAAGTTIRAIVAVRLLRSTNQPQSSERRW